MNVYYYNEYYGIWWASRMEYYLQKLQTEREIFIIHKWIVYWEAWKVKLKDIDIFPDSGNIDGVIIILKEVGLCYSAEYVFFKGITCNSRWLHCKKIYHAILQYFVLIYIKPEITVKMLLIQLILQ